MRVGKDKTKPKEAIFKVSKKAKEHKDHQDCSSCEYDHELTHFSKKLKHGSRKYKGNHPSNSLTVEELDIFHPSSY